MDIASLSDLTTATGGSLYQYTPFNPALDHDQVLNDLKWNVLRPQGMEAVMRVRCSQGLEVDSYLGAFYRQPANPTDVYLPAIDCDKAILANVGSRLRPGIRLPSAHDLRPDPCCLISFLPHSLLHRSVWSRSSLSAPKPTCRRRCCTPRWPASAASVFTPWPSPSPTASPHFSRAQTWMPR